MSKPFTSHLETALWSKAVNIVSDKGHGFDPHSVESVFECLKQGAAVWLADRITEQFLEFEQESRESSGEIV
jgi:hypothetical protein